MIFPFVFHTTLVRVSCVVWFCPTSTPPDAMTELDGLKWISLMSAAQQRADARAMRAGTVSRLLHST
jgi:hypothetical protein